jgi:hypothetical protein
MFPNIYQPLLILLNPVYLFAHALVVAREGVLHIFVNRRTAPSKVLLSVFTDAGGAKSNQAVSYMARWVQSAQKLVMTS